MTTIEPARSHPSHEAQGSQPALQIAVVGAGIVGLWQAFTLARAGQQVTLYDASIEPFAETASRYAGAMIAPHCEAEAAPRLVAEQGLEGARLWREHYPGLVTNGSLVVAPPRDRSELERFAQRTSGHERIDAARLASLEPDLADRFPQALYYPSEAHMTTPDALHWMLQAARRANATCHFGSRWEGDPAALSADVVIDARGLGARDQIPALRGVRGERLLIRSPDIRLRRAVRLLHPRQPLYVVPWSDGRYLVGATVVESEDVAPMTVRSALELLGLAYALHPGFGDAEILDFGAGLRPSLADNVPRVLLGSERRVIRVNGAYRHGFLLAPVLAEVVRAYLLDGLRAHPLLAPHLIE